ncbi:MAG: GAP family protein [Acidimicrobiia bacterium]
MGAASLLQNQIVFRVLRVALVAATSPLALASVLVVLTSGRGRLNGSAFAIGFVVGQALLCALAFAFGTLSFPDLGDRHPTVVAVLSIAFGVALLVTAAFFWRRRSEPVRPHVQGPRTAAIRARLSTLRPLTALGTGAALGIGGPKRIGVTLVATASIAAAGVGEARAVALSLMYVLVATALVWIPVSLYVAFGARAAEWLTSAERWTSAHKEQLTIYPSVVLGVVLILDGVVRLAT